MCLSIETFLLGLFLLLLMIRDCTVIRFVLMILEQDFFRYLSCSITLLSARYTGYLLMNFLIEYLSNYC